LGNYIAHISAMLVTAFGFRFIHDRMKMPRMLIGWVLVLGLNYFVGVSLQVTLFNIAVPSLGATFKDWFDNVWLEFILVSFITSLVLLALPERYRRPQWYEQKMPDQSCEI
jgi:hypothetical protein